MKTNEMIKKMEAGLKYLADKSCYNYVYVSILGANDSEMTACFYKLMESYKSKNIQDVMHPFGYIVFPTEKTYLPLSSWDRELLGYGNGYSLSDLIFTGSRVLETEADSKLKELIKDTYLLGDDCCWFEFEHLGVVADAMMQGADFCEISKLVSLCINMETDITYNTFLKMKEHCLYGTELSALNKNELYEILMECLDNKPEVPVPETEQAQQENQKESQKPDAADTEKVSQSGVHWKWVGIIYKIDDKGRFIQLKEQDGSGGPYILNADTQEEAETAMAEKLAGYVKFHPEGIYSAEVKRRAFCD